MINPKIFKQVRKALGLTQQELADALGLSRVTVNKMEKGKLRRGIPDEIAARLLNLKTRQDQEVTAAKTLQQGTKLHYVNQDNHLWDNEEDES